MSGYGDEWVRSMFKNVAGVPYFVGILSLKTNNQGIILRNLKGWLYVYWLMWSGLMVNLV